jgi:hypothetical protein
MHANSIRYIAHADLDRNKWDQCVNDSPNGLIYAYSFYLDRMSSHWDALVLGDYTSIMPLTWKSRAGIHYLYQPAFTPNLGVFGKNVDAQLVRTFIDAIPNRFRLIEINLNAGNIIGTTGNKDTSFMLRKNYLLPLNRPYNQLYNAYNDNIKRNIKKSVSLGCRLERNVALDKVIQLAKQQLSKISNVATADLDNFSKLYNELALLEKAKSYGVFLGEELLSAAVYFFSNNRAYYILVGNHPNGKTMGTSHYLVDRFIADHAGRNITLDFEGSDINGLAFFYSSFGSKLEQYPSVKVNRLPWYLKWLK